MSPERESDFLGDDLRSHRAGDGETVGEWRQPVDVESVRVTAAPRQAYRKVAMRWSSRLMEVWVTMVTRW